jgi:hypothetical protein
MFFAPFFIFKTSVACPVVLLRRTVRRMAVKDAGCSVFDPAKIPLPAATQLICRKQG